MVKDGFEKFVYGQVLIKNQSSTATVTGDVTSICFWGVSEVCPAKILCDLFFLFLVTVVDQMILGPVHALKKYIVLPLLPCETADFQGWGVTHPYTP